jgi:hypothetical protein
VALYRFRRIWLPTRSRCCVSLFCEAFIPQAFAARLGATTGTQSHVNQEIFREVCIGATWRPVWSKA